MKKNRNIRYYFFIKKLKKVSFYVFLLFLLYFIVKYNSILFSYIKNYYNDRIVNINKNICNKVIINGIKYSDYSYIQSRINNYCSTKNISLKTLKEELLQDYWIKDLYIQKIYPNTLKINIIEYNPFAIYTEDNINYNLIDEYGNNIQIPEKNIVDFNYLFIISGENVKDKINDLFNLLSIYYEISSKVFKIERIGNRRWNLILKNNIVVKLPEENENIFNVWNNLNKIINIHGLDIGLEEIDLRIKDRIYLKYKDQVAEEIKNIK